MREKEIEKLRALVKSNYQTIATDFDLSRKTAIWPPAQEYCQQILAQQKVLDLGCGNGRLYEALKNKQPIYLGVDNSTALLDLARKNYPEAKFILGDILDLGKVLKPEEKFDYIFCLATLQHVPSKNLRGDFLKKLKDHLSEKGEIIISNWNLWSSRHRKLIFKFAILKIFGLSKLDFKDVIFPWKSNQGETLSDRYYHAFTKRELKNLAQLAGFEKINIKKDKHNYWLYLRI